MNENNSNNSNNNQNRNGKDNGPRIAPMLVAVLVVLLIISYFTKALTNATTKEISYNEFISMLENGEVESVKLNSDKISVIPKTSESDNPYTAQVKITYVTGYVETNEQLANRLIDAGIEFSSDIPDNSSWLISIILTYILPLALFFLLISFLSRRMGGSAGVMGVGKSNAKIYVQKETGVTFKDVAGEDEAKESLIEVVDFLHNPGRYVKIGAKLPKGALLVGPPGTGKTLLAKAVAGEAHVPFFSLTGSDFVEMFVGVGASRVRDLFKEASKNAPCIVFIDEIDAIGRSRDSKYGGGNEEREQTLNQLLSEMDGFDPSKGVLVLGATNRPEILDKALLRPGRFDRRIIVERPDVKGREAILRVHAKDVKMDETVDLKEIALATAGSVGSDLANMINEAAINAVKNKREYVSQKDLMESIEQVIAGKEKKDRIMSKEERKIVSYHEIGHALVTALQKNTEPVQKITIIPRTMGALGYVLQVPEEEKYLESNVELKQKLVIYMGGRAAESIVFGSITSGASNDIEQATNLAKNMITRYGMSEKFGFQSFREPSQFSAGELPPAFSEETSRAIDAEVSKLVSDAYARGERLIAENRDRLETLANALLDRETMDGRDVEELLGIRHEEEARG